MSYLSKITLISLVSTLLIFSSCDNKQSEIQGPQIPATIIYTSSSLANHENSRSVLTDSLPLTPFNITGEALSLLFATASLDDEGLVFIGDMRPDIAPSNSTLFPIDLASQLAINSTVSLKPGYVGGAQDHMVNLFGYIDIFVSINATDRQFRLALSDYDVGTNNYIRGDVLLVDTLTGDLNFYDLDNSVFTAVRPANPYVIEEIRDFFDPIRPNMVYYPLNIVLDPNLFFDVNELQTATSIDVVVDFFLEDFVILENTTTTVGISDSALINSFNITQNVVGFGNSGLTATATVVINQ